MTFSSADVLLALRNAGHAVRRQDDRIMIAPPPTHPDDVQAIKDNRDGILALLASEAALAKQVAALAAMQALPEPPDPWGADERSAYTPAEWAERPIMLAACITWNAAIDARPKEVAQRREAKHKPKETTPLLEEPC